MGLCGTDTLLLPLYFDCLLSWLQLFVSWGFFFHSVDFICFQFLVKSLQSPPVSSETPGQLCVIPRNGQKTFSVITV